MYCSSIRNHLFYRFTQKPRSSNLQELPFSTQTFTSTELRLLKRCRHMGISLLGRPRRIQTLRYCEHFQQKSCFMKSAVCHCATSEHKHTVEINSLFCITFSLEFARVRRLLSISGTSGSRPVTRIGDTLATPPEYSRYTPEL